MEKEKIKFGTSGFRAVIGEGFTKENVQKIAFGVAKYLKNNKKEKTLISVGFDNRFLGKEASIWLSEVLLFEGFKVQYVKNPTNSPVMAYFAKLNGFSIIITASHNPFNYNGIKMFTEMGCDVSEEITNYIAEVANSISYDKINAISFSEAEKKGNLIQISENLEYINSVISNLNAKTIKSSNLKVLVNVMHGTSKETIESLFKRIGYSNYEIMNGEKDFYFGNGLPAPYVNNLSDQIKKIKSEKFDLGFALDGDGDRLTVLDETGKAYDCTYIACLMFDYLLNERKMRGNFVKNIPFSSLPVFIAKKYNQKVFTSKVGFKNIANYMKIAENEAILGSESNGVALSGHILFKDGIMALFFIFEILSSRNQKLSDLIKKLKKDYNFPCEYEEFAYPITKEKKENLQKNIFENKKLPKLNQFIKEVTYEDGLKVIFENEYWFAIRFSGTENVVRIYVEMPSKKECDEMVTVLEKFASISVRQV